MSTGTDAGVEEIARLIGDLAAASAGTPAERRRLAGLLADRFGAGSHALCAGADRALLDAVADPVSRGWTPRDLLEIARRRAGAAATPPAGDVLAAHAARGPRGAGAQVAALGVSVWWDRARPLVAQWSHPHRGAGRGLSDAEALRTVVGLVHVWRTLPTLPRGSGADGADGAGGDAADVPAGVDPRVLARVRALLAKAESTTFPEEAEALTAKAQELMGRHALEQAVVDHDAGRGDGAGARRIWLDAPYAAAKAHLVHQVAGPNRCRAVGLTSLDMVTVVGHPADLAVVELLVTSLLVQADRALLAEGPDPGGGSGRRSRTRAFRHAFLLSYATRIGERLAEAAREARTRTRAEVGEGLLPVLAARAEVVDARVAELFGPLTTRRTSVGDAAGWHAGRAAADTATLTPGRGSLEQ